MLRFWKSSSAPERVRRLGILPAAFNPPTIAHLEIARHAARQHALDEVVFLLPEVFPHKGWEGATFEQRVEMLQAALADEPRFSCGSSDKGLFIEIARACRPIYPEAEFFFLCGRDAAERIMNWDYGAEIPFAAQLEHYQMLVAPRGGPAAIPPAYAGRIHPLDVAPEFESFSSSAVREAIAAGQAWEHLAPGAVAAIIQRDRLYAA